MKKSTKISLVIALVLVLSIYVISAQEDFLEDFEITSPSDIYVYKCSPANAQFEVVNTGAVKSDYRVLLSNEKFVSVSPAVFSLEPKQKQTLWYTIKPSCNVKDKTSLKTKIVTLYGNAKEVEQTIIASNPENIDVKIKNEASGLSCEKTKFDIELFNLYNFDETYSLAIDKFEEEAEFSENEILLQPGKSKNVSLLIKTNDCSLSGDFPLTLTASTENTKLKGEFDLNLKLKSANLFGVSLDNKIELNVGENKTIKASIENKGDLISVYELSLKAPEWAKLSPKRIAVDPKKTESVSIDLKPTKEVKSGKYDLVFEATIKDSSKTASKITTVQVTNPEDNLFKNLIANKMVVYATISFLVLVILFVTASKIFLARKRRKTVVEADNKKQKQSQNKKLDKKSLKVSPLRVAQDLKSRKEELDLLEAVDKEHNKVWFALKKALGILLLIALILAGGFFALKYQEFLKQNLVYSLAGLAVVIIAVLFAALSDLFKTEEQKLAEIDKKIAALKKKEQKRKEKEKADFEKFKLEELNRIKKEVDADYRASNKIVPLNELVETQKVKKDFKGFWTLALILLVSSIAGAVKWKLDVFVKNMNFVIAGFASLAFLLLLKLLFCTGKVKKKWKIAIVDQKYELFVNWKKGLQTVSFVLQKPAEKLKLFVRKGKDKTTNIIPSKATYKFFRIKSNVAEDTFKEVKFSFKVKLNWLKRNEVVNTDVKLVRFADSNWTELSTELLNEDGKFAYFQATSNTIGQFAIIGKPKPKKKESRKGLIVLGVLFAIAIVVVTLLAITQKPQEPIKGIPDQTLDVNGVLKLDLSAYFNDPDSDKLTFTASKTERLKIDFADSTAVVSSELGWTGQELVTFFASDGKGGVAQSNKVIFTVKQPLIPSQYLPWAINGGVAFLLLLIVILLVKYKSQLLKFLDEE